MLLIRFTRVWDQEFSNRFMKRCLLTNSQSVGYNCADKVNARSLRKCSNGRWLSSRSDRRGKVIIEIKSTDAIAPVHRKQLLTYLRLTDKRLGLLINFNVEFIKDGITRVVNNL